MCFALDVYAKHNLDVFDPTMPMLAGCMTNEWRIGIALAAELKHRQIQAARSLRIAA